jgi:hypothetical protein
LIWDRVGIDLSIVAGSAAAIVRSLCLQHCATRQKPATSNERLYCSPGIM